MNISELRAEVLAGTGVVSQRVFINSATGLRLLCYQRHDDAFLFFEGHLKRAENGDVIAELVDARYETEDDDFQELSAPAEHITDFDIRFEYYREGYYIHVENNFVIRFTLARGRGDMRATIDNRFESRARRVTLDQYDNYAQTLEIAHTFMVSSEPFLQAWMKERNDELARRERQKELDNQVTAAAMELIKVEYDLREAQEFIVGRMVLRHVRGSERCDRNIHRSSAAALVLKHVLVEDQTPASSLQVYRLHKHVTALIVKAMALVAKRNAEEKRNAK